MTFRSLNLGGNSPWPSALLGGLVRNFSQSFRLVVVRRRTGSFGFADQINSSFAISSAPSRTHGVDPLVGLFLLGQ